MKAKTKKNNNDKTISFRLDPIMVEYFEAIAKESKLGLSTLMRNVCKQWLVFANDTKEYAKRPMKLTFDNKHQVDAILLFNVKDAAVISDYAGKVMLEYPKTIKKS